jgi:Cofactor assembly of complex C subunit B, CCB2/CCB4
MHHDPPKMRSPRPALPASAVRTAWFVAVLLLVVVPTATHGFVVVVVPAITTTTTSRTPPLVLRRLLPNNKKPLANAARSSRRRRHQDHDSSAERTSHLIHNSQSKEDEEASSWSRRQRPWTTTKNPLDAALTWLISDTGSVLLGGVGLFALLVSRFGWSSSTDIDDADSVTALTRATLLAVMAIGAVLLNGLSQLDVPTALAETVRLEGEFIPTTQFVNVNTNRNSRSRTTTESETAAAWVLESLVQATPASSAVYLQRRFDRGDHDNDDESSSLSSGWQMVGYVGILPPDLVQSPASFTLPTQTPILARFISKKRATTNKASATETTTVLAGESYLPTLQALPGKVEFTYLPRNTQAVLVLPTTTTTSSSGAAAEVVVVVLGANRARSFTPRDIAWCQAAVSQLL